MIDFDGKEMQEEFNKVFDGKLTIETLTPRQLWWLTKFAKHVRGRCRNNSAFNNYMNRNFSPARFGTVAKQYTDRNGIVKHYDGLKITVNDETVEGDENV